MGISLETTSLTRILGLGRQNTINNHYEHVPNTPPPKATIIMSDDTPEVHDHIVQAGPITKAELAEDLAFMSPDEIFVAVEKLEEASKIERRNDYERYRTSEDVFIALEDTLGHELDPIPVPEPEDSTMSAADVFDDHSSPEIRLDKDNNRILLNDIALTLRGEDGVEHAIDHASTADGYVAFADTNITLNFEDIPKEHDT